MMRHDGSRGVPGGTPQEADSHTPTGGFALPLQVLLPNCMLFAQVAGK